MGKTSFWVGTDLKSLFQSPSMTAILHEIYCLQRAPAEKHLAKENGVAISMKELFYFAVQQPPKFP